MSRPPKKLLTPEGREKCFNLFTKGRYREVSKRLYRKGQDLAAAELKSLINEFNNSEMGRGIASRVRYQHGYGPLRKSEVTITLRKGDKVKVKSWYATKVKKKPGRKKRGRNGQGSHLLLDYWGFIDKQSPDYLSHIVRSGTAAMSYELAAQDLKEQGFSLVSKTVNNLVQKIGNKALGYRDELMFETGEDWSGKRVVVAIDGGRARTRKAKKGRFRRGQKRAHYKTDWREPKLVVISELDEDGHKKRGTKPIYEATLGNADQIYNLLEKLTTKCHLEQAREIVFLADGADWIWNRCSRWQKKFGIKHKTIEVLDWYHAVEHLSAASEEYIILSKKERKAWFRKLKGLLRARQYQKLQREIKGAAQKCEGEHKQKLMKESNYFKKNKQRINYPLYEQNNQPIGSGIVESAVRRVINLKLKSPSIFWKPENLERLLHLRCILMAQRWHTFFDNLVAVQRLSLPSDTE